MGQQRNPHCIAVQHKLETVNEIEFVRSMIQQEMKELRLLQQQAELLDLKLKQRVLRTKVRIMVTELRLARLTRLMAGAQNDRNQN